MLTEKEMKMYQAQKRRVKLICKDGRIFEGLCTEFSNAYDNDPEDASITLKNGKDLLTGELLYPLTEIYESEIDKIEYLN